MGATDTQSVEAAEVADELLGACAALRHELVLYERELRRMRNRVLKGMPNPEPHVVPELVEARVRMNTRFEEMERCRRQWRVAYFGLQTASGMSLGAIAREWGLSRQLVSRLMGSETATT
jgi:hypothetical protein